MGLLPPSSYWGQRVSRKAQHLCHFPCCQRASFWLWEGKTDTSEYVLELIDPCVRCCEERSHQLQLFNCTVVGIGIAFVGEAMQTSSHHMHRAISGFDKDLPTKIFKDQLHHHIAYGGIVVYPFGEDARHLISLQSK